MPAVLRQKTYRFDEEVEWFSDWIYEAATVLASDITVELLPIDPELIGVKWTYVVQDYNDAVVFPKASVFVLDPKWDVSDKWTYQFQCGDKSYLDHFNEMIKEFEFKISYVQRVPNAQSGPVHQIRDNEAQVDLILLRQILELYFNRSELQVICFDLGIDYENLPEQKADMARELILQCKREGRLDELVAMCQKERPNAPW